MINSNKLVYTSCFTSCQKIQDLRKLENIRKKSKRHRIIAQCSVLLKEKFCQYYCKSPKKQKLNFSHSMLFHMKIKVCLILFVNNCLCKQFLDSNSPQTPSNLIRLTVSTTLRPLTQFSPKIRATNLPKMPKVLKLVLLDNYFPDLFKPFKFFQKDKVNSSL